MRGWWLIALIPVWGLFAAVTTWPALLLLLVVSPDVFAGTWSRILEFAALCGTVLGVAYAVVKWSRNTE